MSLRLSDAFIMPEHESKLPIAAEIVATMYNLNAAENEGLLTACNKLNDYVKCVNIIRSKKLEYEDSRAAVNAAITECIEQDILSEFLVKHRAEVLEMCLTEFDEEAYKKEYIEIGREEGRAEGRAEGEAITTARIIHSLYKSGMSARAIADALGMTTDEVNEILK